MGELAHDRADGIRCGVRLLLELIGEVLLGAGVVAHCAEHVSGGCDLAGELGELSVRELGQYCRCLGEPVAALIARVERALAVSGPREHGLLLMASCFGQTHLVCSLLCLGARVAETSSDPSASTAATSPGPEALDVAAGIQITELHWTWHGCGPGASPLRRRSLITIKGQAFVCARSMRAAVPSRAMRRPSRSFGP